jgi:hypothetical protein
MTWSCVWLGHRWGYIAADGKRMTPTGFATSATGLGAAMPTQWVGSGAPLLPLSKAAQAARRPPAPIALLEAEQDRPNLAPTRARKATAFRAGAGDTTLDQSGDGRKMGGRVDGLWNRPISPSARDQ